MPWLAWSGPDFEIIDGVTGVLASGGLHGATFISITKISRTAGLLRECRAPARTPAEAACSVVTKLPTHILIATVWIPNSASFSSLVVDPYTRFDEVSRVGKKLR